MYLRYLFFHILRSTNYAQKIAKPRPHVSQSVSHLTPGYTGYNGKSCSAFIACGKLIIYFFFKNLFFIILMFFQHLLEMISANVLRRLMSTSSRFKFMHIAYVNSSKERQEGWKEGRKYADMVIDICTYVCVFLCILDWLLLPFSAHNLHISICRHLFVSFFVDFFFTTAFFFGEKFNCQ